MSAEPRELARAARRWLSLADEHLVLARHAFVLKSAVPYRLIAFHAQQCAEAALKAYLVSRNVEFPFTHNIARLREMCAEHGDWAEALRDAEELSPFAVTARYNLDDEPVSRDEAHWAVEVDADVLAAVRAEVVAS